ncbi:hypothetical protein [Corynebacterium sp. HMSC077B05]|uniref:hypothetical protein n=1 Tax=Corynebacterium sp. HMSC077B05 TaxID=1739252 RepID=UPI0008A15A3C|nr:hypothetical protein [Corynebacterium sp. HMSC077B05]OFL77602.1 hypothetical protein HMPREF2748_03575 [Corynebacterium sp. HMSC077B05]
MKYRPNREGLRELLRGTAAKALVIEHGDRLANAAGEGFELSTQQGKSRFRGIIYPNTWSARRREAKNNVLIRVLG